MKYNSNWYRGRVRDKYMDKKIITNKIIIIIFLLKIKDIHIIIIIILINSRMYLKKINNFNNNCSNSSLNTSYIWTKRD